MTSKLTDRTSYDGRLPHHYGLRSATVREGDIAMGVHLVAASRGSALAYGPHTLRAGAAIVLTVGSLDLLARVGWCDGRRARLDVIGDLQAFAAVMEIAPSDRELEAPDRLHLNQHFARAA
jgi:hypothetical protein